VNGVVLTSTPRLEDDAPVLAKSRLTEQAGPALERPSGDGQSGLYLRMDKCRSFGAKNGIRNRLESHMLALSFHCMVHNFVRIKGPVDITPAMSAGLTDSVWTLHELLSEVAPKP
jgi:hypothetical protein